MRAADIVLCASLALGASPLHAADPAQGKLLYETHCGTCHYEKLHDRKISKIDTLSALRAEVAKWAAQTDRRFSPAELEAIEEYLNLSHYHLTK